MPGAGAGRAAKNVQGRASEGLPAARAQLGEASSDLRREVADSPGEFDSLPWRAPCVREDRPRRLKPEPHSIALWSLEGLAGPGVRFGDLKESVRSACLER